MHSAHHSRGRIVFEVFCALALAASLAGAWAQTDASALLSAAAVAALYGVWRLTDLRRPKAAQASAPVAAEEQGDLLAYAPPAPAAEAPQAPEAPVEAVVEEKPGRKAPKPRKSRRAKEAQPTIAEITDRLEREIGKVADEPAAPDPEPEPDVVDSPSQASEYLPATPLFEPEPFVRQQRAAFGRKARR